MNQEQQLYEAAAKYKQRFGDTPTIVNLDPALQQKAIQLLRNSLTSGRGFKNDKEWSYALGVPPPPNDAVL